MFFTVNFIISYLYQSVIELLLIHQDYRNTHRGMTKYFRFLPLLIVVLLMSQTSVLATKTVADDVAETESPIDIMGTVADHDYFTFWYQIISA